MSSSANTFNHVSTLIAQSALDPVIVGRLIRRSNTINTLQSLVVLFLAEKFQTGMRLYRRFFMFTIVPHSERTVMEWQDNPTYEGKAKGEPYWILALDGGGCRCVLTMVLLRRIFERFPTLEKRIQLVAGSSAGALVGGAFATKGFEQAYEMVMAPDFMKRVFTTSYAHDMYAVNGWYAAMYKNDALKAIANEHFSPEDCIGDFPKSPDRPDVVITSFCIDRKQYQPDDAAVAHEDAEIDMGESQVPEDEWAPRIYHTFDWHDGHGHTSVVDVMLQTTAAPTYFPAHKGCVDGGITANNPSLVALSTAKYYKKFNCITEARVLSIGTGVWPSNMDSYGPSANLGKMQWLPHLVTLMIDSSAEITCLNCKNLLGDEGFHRVQMRLPRYVALEDYTAYDDLKKWAEAYDLTDTFAWIESNL